MTETFDERTDRIDTNLHKLNRSTNWFSSLLVIAVAVVFASSIWTNYKVITLTSGLNHTQAHLAMVQRDEAEQTRVARIASCRQFDVQQRSNVAAQIKLSEDFVAALTAGSTDPIIAARAVAFNASHDALIRAKYPLRDCSPSGIARYLGIDR